MVMITNCTGVNVTVDGKCGSIKVTNCINTNILF